MNFCFVFNYLLFVLNNYFFIDGTFTALIIDFGLSSCCYATMALRELMKINTSWDGQKLSKKPEDSTESSQKEAKPENLTEEKSLIEKDSIDKNSENCTEESQKKISIDNPVREELKEEHVSTTANVNTEEVIKTKEEIIETKIDELNNEDIIESNLKRKIRDEEESDIKKQKTS